ncbi:uncharacterized protein PGTG_17442, partial [Puccinia graminis f. sp. tritici CRL 75-36-700-3]
MAAPGETNFDQISQKISPAEVFKLVDSPSAQLPQGVQKSQDPSPPDKNHGQPLEEDHQSSENQPNGSSANLQAPNSQNNSTKTTSSVPPPPPNDSTSQPTASTDPLTNLTMLKSRNARISVVKYPSASPLSYLPSANDFLASLPNDQWNFPDVIDFPLIALYSQLEKSGSSKKFISPTNKTKHPESTIIHFLHQLQSPPPSVISKWAKIIAASVEVMAFNLYTPPPPTPDTDDNPINQGLQFLQWLEGLKNSLSTFETPRETQPTSAAPEGEVVLRSHTIDVLKDFSKVIINVFMGYIIFQVHALSPPPLTNSQIKKQAPAPQENSAFAVTQKTTGGAFTTTSTSTKQLKSIQSQHNFQPLTYFLIGGVRGLLSVPGITVHLQHQN